MNSFRKFVFKLLIVSIMAASTADGASNKRDRWNDLYDELSSRFTSDAVKCGLQEKSFNNYHCACVRKGTRKPYNREAETEWVSSEETPMLRSNTGRRRPNTLGSDLDSLLDQVPSFPALPKIPPMPSFSKGEKVQPRGKTTGYSYKKEISTYQENDNPPEVEGYEIFKDYATGKKVVKKYGP